MYRETERIEQQPYRRRQFPRKHSETGIRRVRQARIRAPGGDLRGAPLQPAQQRGISKAGGSIRADAAERGVDRRAAQARPTGTSGLLACGHGASRRLGWSQRGVPHQRRGRGPAMGSDRLRQQQRAVFDTGAGSDTGTVSISNIRIPFRQGLRSLSITRWPGY